MKRPDQAREQRQAAAAAVVRPAAEGLEDDYLRETFLGTAPVLKILEHANL